MKCILTSNKKALSKIRLTKIFKVFYGYLENDFACNLLAVLQSDFNHERLLICRN